jgi:yecA family protein
MPQTPLRYDDIESALLTLDAEMEPSEMHGAVCGILCAGEKIDANSLINTLFSGLDKNNLLQQEAVAQVAAMIEQTLEQLNDPTCDFHLLLPEDTQDNTRQRIDALSEWCRGFLFGMSAGGVQDLENLPEEAAEIAKDFVEISRASSDYELEGGAEDEASLQQLLEYVRVGVLLINEVLHPTKAPPVDSSTLH